MTPLDRYRQELARPDFSVDPVQAAAMSRLDAIYAGLLAYDAPARPRFFKRWRAAAARAPLRGLYLWGGVGRGKTFMVDIFFDCLPEGSARRVHFHSFMRSVHAELKEIRGVQNPLKHVVAGWAEGLRILCLDEFHVVDITDAMLLSQLLSAMFERGISLVTTSNEAPDALYRGGLQRERFLPAVALLKAHLDVFEFSSMVDYRLRTLTQAATYYHPQSRETEQALARQFAALAHGTLQSSEPVTIEGRAIPVRTQAEGVVWFDFDELCGGPRAAADYIEIACCFHTVVVSGIPLFSDDQNDAARRFVNLVDEFYDSGVNLLVSAAAGPTGLYRGTRLRQPFQRTVSRLIEMQSEEYLAKPHVSP
ncbi:MAG: cell division protein ZapE [Gammaproteobacteria bacterium]|nr:cell division protein ZapE [Gammaproteobacteria bacterium]